MRTHRVRITDGRAGLDANFAWDGEEHSYGLVLLLRHTSTWTAGRFTFDNRSLLCRSLLDALPFVPWQDTDQVVDVNVDGDLRIFCGSLDFSDRDPQLAGDLAGRGAAQAL